MDVVAWLNQRARSNNPAVQPVVSYKYDPRTGVLAGYDAHGNTVVTDATLSMVAQSGGNLFNVTDAPAGTGLIYSAPTGDNLFGNVDAATVQQLAAQVGAHVNVQNVTYSQYKAARGSAAYNMDAAFDSNGNPIQMGQHSYAPGQTPPAVGGSAAAVPFTPTGQTSAGNQPFGQGFGDDNGLGQILAAGDPNAGFGGNAPPPGQPQAMGGLTGGGGGMLVGLAQRNVPQATLTATRPVSAAAAARVAGTPVTPTTTGTTTGTTTSAPAAGTAAAGKAGTADQQNAFTDLKTVLDQYGLGSLSTWAWNEILNGASESQVVLDMYQTPEFKAAFPEITARQQSGLPPLTPADVINYRTQATQIMRDAGLPQGFWDSPQDFSSLLASDVSLSELQQRVGLASQAAFQVPADVRATLQRDYGVGAGQLAAYFLDPKTAEPLLAQQFTSAQIGGAAYRTGYGSTKNEDEYLTSLGVNAQQAQQGFTQLTGQRQLFDSLPGENTTGISRDQQLGAAFAGNSVDQETVTRRAQTRAAQFGGGGQFSAGQSGFAGIGQAQGA